MFDFFKKKPKAAKNPTITLVDLDGIPLQEGDIVESFRYNLGPCKVVLMSTSTTNIYGYESKSTGEQVSWVRMVDASTNRQKVKKIP